MRMSIVPAAAVALMFAAPMAFASTMANGTIKAFDLKALTLTLDNGTIYHLTAGFKDPGLKVGEKVAVTWVKKGALYDASAVMIVK